MPIDVNVPPEAYLGCMCGVLLVAAAMALYLMIFERGE
jgi:hypothetical protein